MNDRQMKRLMDMMHASSGAVINAHAILHDPDSASDMELRDMALKLQEESAFRLALVVDTFIQETIDRRHKTGNFQYPFPPFDEWGPASRE